ncbi:MAG: hypothetical protein JJE49_10875 [Peptostreptococcaceae bacterium]|nr:hypothetical protein [Peptostreptococcaceae bacterium]
MTLAFFGEILTERIEKIIKVMNDAPCNGAFLIHFNEAGVIGKRGGDIWWIGIEKSEELSHLQIFLVEKLVKEGFSLENRPFSPNINLGRSVELWGDLEISEF